MEIGANGFAGNGYMQPGKQGADGSAPYDASNATDASGQKLHIQQHRVVIGIAEIQLLGLYAV